MLTTTFTEMSTLLLQHEKTRQILQHRSDNGAEIRFAFLFFFFGWKPQPFVRGTRVSRLVLPWATRIGTVGKWQLLARI